jgi:hypothetical protein
VTLRDPTRGRPDIHRSVDQVRGPGSGSWRRRMQFSALRVALSCYTALRGNQGRLRHCCVASAQGKLKSPRPLGSDRQDQFVERDHQPPIRGLLDRQFGVSAPNVLDEGVPGDDHSGAAVLLEPSHLSQRAFSLP